MGGWIPGGGANASVPCQGSVLSYDWARLELLVGRRPLVVRGTVRPRTFFRVGFSASEACLAVTCSAGLDRRRSMGAMSMSSSPVIRVRASPFLSTITRRSWGVRGQGSEIFPKNWTTNLENRPRLGYSGLRVLPEPAYFTFSCCLDALRHWLLVVDRL